MTMYDNLATHNSGFFCLLLLLLFCFVNQLICLSDLLDACLPFRPQFYVKTTTCFAEAWSPFTCCFIKYNSVNNLFSFVSQSWVPLKYQGTETESSLKYFKRMVAQESTPLQFAMNPYVLTVVFLYPYVFFFLPLFMHTSLGCVSCVIFKSIRYAKMFHFLSVMSRFEYLDSLCPGSSTNDVQAKGRSKKYVPIFPSLDLLLT